MSDPLWDIVVGALNKATGLLNTPDIARRVLSGGDLDFADIDMDSLTLFEVIMEIEEKLGIDLDADEMAEQTSLSGLLLYLRDKKGHEKG